MYKLCLKHFSCLNFAFFGLIVTQKGDIVECEIDEIGTITNKIE